MNDDYFYIRLKRDPAESKVWQAIVEHLQKTVIKGTPEHSLDLGCGYGDFSRHLQARHKSAIDLGPMQEHQAKGVNFTQGNIFEYLKNHKSSYDLVFASNLLEHLERDEAFELLKQIFDQMSPSGRIILIQPNFRFCYRNYFDDYTHRTIFTDESLAGLMEATGFKITHRKSRYLPFSMRGNILPKTFTLTKWYLELGSPILGAQMMLSGVKN
jgi:2-polyprenyl-3-methyl-5-hydroxy-6-metoxy-1,4-benzoquinol methylase